jgi:hypothetical protein
MVETNNNNSVANNQKTNNGKPIPQNDEDDAVMMRLPECLVIMSPDSTTDNGRTRDGKIGLKYGSEKSDWIWMPYMSMKKLIDLCKEHREMFNEQLSKERQRLAVDDL